MNRQCPKCAHELPRLHYIAFLRLFSAPCPQCGTLLAIENRGRNALWGVLVASVPFGVLLSQAIPPAVAFPVALVVGFVASVHVASSVGHIGLSPEDSSYDRYAERKPRP